MIKDYMAKSIEDLQSNFSLLGEAETSLEQAKHISNEEEKKKEQGKARKQIHDQHMALLRHIPSTTFHFLAVSEIADKDGFRNFWQSAVLKKPGAIWNQVQGSGDEGWNLRALAEILEQPSIPIEYLTPLSFHISLSFTLNKPYLSRDDDSFHIIDNPVKKEKVLRLPYVSPSSFKGALRAATRQRLGVISEETNGQIVEFDKPEVERLFGIDKYNEHRIEANDFNAGRLRFFPTLFHQIGLELINPHDRKQGAGTVPIQFETAKGEGNFNLLYFPHDLDPTNQDQITEVAEDIINVAQGLKDMFTVYGFGAKTSNGFGAAKSIKNGKFRMRFDNAPEVKAPSVEPLPSELAVFFDSNGELNKYSETEIRAWTKPKRQKYEKALKLVERKHAVSAVAEQATVLPVHPIFEKDFMNWQHLIEVTEQLRNRLLASGGSINDHS